MTGCNIQHKNTVTSLIKKAKRKYTPESIVKHKSNSGEMWEMLLIPEKKTVINMQKLVDGV